MCVGYGTSAEDTGYIEEHEDQKNNPGSFFKAPPSALKCKVLTNS